MDSPGESRPASTAVAASARAVVPRRRVLPLALLLHMVLFFQGFQGCDRSGIRLTAGPLLPCVELEQKDRLELVRIVTFSPVRLAINLIVVMLLLNLAAHRFPRLARVFASRGLLVTCVLVALVFNSVLVAESVWLNLVFFPTAEVYEAAT